ncbi:MAG: hypothetical protein QM723_35385 [Myxococcaceae bacterium]
MTNVDPAELAHWKAVAAKPFDEAPRWEYLKWLQAQKDPNHQERAKFMALQMDAAFSKPWDLLALEAANFRSVYLPAWGPILPSTEREDPSKGNWTPSYVVLQWREGFPDGLQVWHPHKLGRQVSEWLKSTPLTTLDYRENVEPTFGAFFDLVRGDEFKKLRSLRVRPNLEACDALLTECERGSLHELIIDGVWASGRLPNANANLFQTLARRPFMKQLRSLGLLMIGVHDGAPPESLEVFASLERLSVNDAIRGEHLRALLEASTQVRRLELHGGGWGEVVASWSRVSQLEELVVVKAPARDLRALMATNKLERLVSLRIEGVRDATTEDFKFVFGSLNRLQRLSIRQSSLDDSGLGAFLESHAFPHLLALDLQLTRVTDESLFQMTKSIHLPRLKWVRVHPIGGLVSSQCVYALNQRWRPGNALAFE